MKALGISGQKKTHRTVGVMPSAYTLHYPFPEAKRKTIFFLEEMASNLSKSARGCKMRAVGMSTGQMHIDFQSFDGNKLHKKTCRITICKH